MALRTSVKTTSAVGAFFRRQAQDMARKVAARGGVLRRFADLFLIRAHGVAREGRGAATIVEVPPFLLGGFGGRNYMCKLYVPAVVTGFGSVIDDLARETMRLDPGTGDYLPHKSDDQYTTGYPMGDGRVTVGEVPDWSAGRVALDEDDGALSTGAYTICASALTIGVVCAIPDDQQTLLVCRSTPQMAPGLKVDDSGLPVMPEDPEAEQPEVPPDWYPAISGGVPMGSPARISGVEIARSAVLDSSNHRLDEAGPCIEWGPLAGAAMVAYRRRDEDDNFLGDGVALVRYAISDAGESAGGGARFTGSLEETQLIDVSLLPGSDQPDNPSAVAAVDFEDHYVPLWADTYLLTDGRPASDGFLRLPRNLNATARLWAAGVGAPVEEPVPLLTLLEFAATYDSTVEVDVEGYMVDGGAPGGYSYLTKTCRSGSGVRHLTYVCTQAPGAAPVLRKIAEFVDDRYNTGGALTRDQWQAYGAVTAADGEPWLFCTKRAVPYEVRPAEPDIPESPWLSPRIQGEPARRVLAKGYSYIQPSELTAVLVSADSEVELNLGAYFPALETIFTSEVGDGDPELPPGRRAFGDSALYEPSSAQQYGNSFPVPFCQYAPGVMLLLGHPNAQFENDTWPLSIFTIEVATGEVIDQLNTGISVAYNSRLTLSCMEQAVVDPDTGDIVAHGKLMLSISTTDFSEGRRDGIYLIHGLHTISWLTREPSNVAAVYAGNALAPAALGVTMNLMSVPRPKVTAV